MGSRKKKISRRPVTALAAYKELNIDDKIAMKAWLYWWGRQRETIAEFLQRKFNSECFARLTVKNLVEDGHFLLSGIYQKN